MPKRSSRDINAKVFSIAQQAIGEKRPEPVKEKNAAAVALGRLGGLKGGKSRAEALTSEQRSDIARKAAKSRWNKLG